ncbi:hypothetical protein SPRG_13666 [Saprolegnia parasitica CBS 223.65]|uniref:Globin domain-containing protein n=1 Tax=Saprolegnia parasitica (strain CBS 223.65) TaxID=695850 RepID=A0A067BWY1_SAPPC|nr:hypothetical protein SPRG_13666 [Saprolegnia parasitica CBS 223.65]KDO21350.1 hypothetical protein SPRG_13666 [Saprolegnia parasitica CBS 223.65]|eukprot:XP_012207909.1 hypothetical protein SPRG_13666 [Saprolegnia parasitica CBS 223.65]
MGNSPSGKAAKVLRLRQEEVDVDVDHLGSFSFGLARDYEVQHYMPPQFPIIPLLTKDRVMTCQRTWDLVQNASTEKMKQYGKPGIVLFYDEFFYRLFERDTTMALVFPNTKQRGEVLIKALTFILGVRADAPSDVENVKNSCRFLGHRHRTFMKVRPHHFATYALTMVEVVMYWLGDLASHNVGQAWSNTTGFILRYLLEPYLYERTDPYELYQNTTIAAVREITESSAASASVMDNKTGRASSMSSART